MERHGAEFDVKVVLEFDGEVDVGSISRLDVVAKNLKQACALLTSISPRFTFQPLVSWCLHVGNHSAAHNPTRVDEYCKVQLPRDQNMLQDRSWRNCLLTTLDPAATLVIARIQGEEDNKSYFELHIGPIMCNIS